MGFIPTVGILSLCITEIRLYDMKCTNNYSEGTVNKQPIRTILNEIRTATREANKKNRSESSVSHEF